jgi:beta-lactamase regulating signal transducer with metallopeptidase domain
MGMLWFDAFVLLGLLMRKLKYPVKFSVAPLLLMLVLSVFRMFAAIEVPGAVIILSETFYPAVVNFLRLEIISVSVTDIFVFIWIIGAVYFSARSVYRYNSRRGFVNLIGSSSTRDNHAEELLSEIIGYDKYFRVFRNDDCSSPGATAFKPYIILPKINFTDEQLRGILLHEWKHIKDKDHLTRIIVEIICFVFWWNPLVYILRKNFSFARELKCDRFAVSNKEELIHYIRSMQLVDTRQKQATKDFTENKFIGAGYETADRLNVLVLLGTSRRKRIITNVLFFIAILGLFAASYMFTILPAFWYALDVPIIAGDFTEEYREGGGIFTTEENYLVDNDDGTFSLYIDGQFAMYVDADSDLLNWVEIRARESN